jgi:hypothetical protein
MWSTLGKEGLNGDGEIMVSGLDERDGKSDRG